MPTHAYPQVGGGTERAPPTAASSSAAATSLPAGYMPTSNLRSITQRMPTGQMQALAGEWAHQPPAAPPAGGSAQPPPQRMPTGTQQAIPHLPPVPPAPPLTSTSVHPLAQTGPHLPPPAGHSHPSLNPLSSAAVSMPQGTVAAHQTGPHQMLPGGVLPANGAAVAAPGNGPMSAAGSSPQGLLPFPIPGSTLASSRGNYVVGQLIGDGQYGSVYECMGPFDQLYALKMLRPSNKPYQAVKDEWVREMQRLESFRHPNIVYIHDAFEDNYLFYLALERCDTSLRNLARAPLPDPLFLEISRQLLMALAYLHDSGLVHSDLHAGNVLVSQVDQHPIVKLTDFGVAHQLDGSTTWYRPQVANPKIIAPELLTAGYTTRQSDLYQLGLLMFQMHTGHPAIDVDRMQYGDTTRMIAEGTPRVLAEALNTRFSPVIAKLLRRRDAYRYQSAREVWDDLRLHARR